MRGKDETGINIRLPDDMYFQLKFYAKKHRLKIKDIILEAIDTSIKNLANKSDTLIQIEKK